MIDVFFQFSVSECVLIKAGDRIGLTSVNKAMVPLAGNFDINEARAPTSFRNADSTSSSSFIHIGYPYSFSFGAGYTNDITCDNIEDNDDNITNGG